MALISMMPMPPASATAEPDMPAKITLPRMLAWHSPPFHQPTHTVANRKMRTVMPEEFIRLPMRMYMGAASSGKLSAALVIFCGMAMGLMPATETKAAPASAIERYIGIPVNSDTNQMARMISMAVVTTGPPPLRYGLAGAGAGWRWISAPSSAR